MSIRTLSVKPTRLWVLHVLLWKDNPAGIFEDWNPAVLCPDGVPVFGVDLP